MPIPLHFNYTFVIFIILALAKTSVELYAGSRKRRATRGASHSLSIAFLIIGFGTPVFIFSEIVILGHLLPLWVCIVLAIISILLQLCRFLTLRTLGKFFTVDVCVFNDHRLIKAGPYKYIRHPLYLIGLFDYPIYPLACGAYLTAIIMGIAGWIVVFMRRREEEKVLLEKFGKEYIEYKKQTWF